MDIAYTVFDNKAELYEFIVKQVRRLGEETSEKMSLLSNISALLKIELENVNWAGFYLLQGGRLVLGPFQGKPAVAEIAIGQGVCGTAVKEKRTQLVDDVHKCSNHIACDISTFSEIVVTIECNGELFGVIDIDSPISARFDEEDRYGLEMVSRAVSDILEKLISRNKK